MTIIEALKDTDQNLRVSNGRTWLTWDGENWAIHRRPDGARNTQTIWTDDECKAVAELLKD